MRDINRYSEDRTRTKNSTKIFLEFAIENEATLKCTDKGRRALAAAEDMKAQLDRGEELSAAQISYAEGIYEETIHLVTGLPKVTRHIDRKRKGLRY